MSADLQNILDLIEAFRRSKAMFTAVGLGVFDALAKGSKGSAELAQELKLDPAALTRLLDACVSLKLLEREGHSYSNSASASRFLVRETRGTLAGYIKYSDQSLYKLWDNLGDAIREGSNRWAQTFGSRASLFDHYFRDEESTRSFLTGMHAFGHVASDKVVRSFDLSRFKHLVDLGGATGHLAIAACQAYPELKATVLDLPVVERFAREYISHSGVSQRLDFVSADFFVDDLPSADLYSLGRIIHDWGDAKISKLLNKIVGSLPSEGGLLVSETLLNADRSGPVSSLMQDLNMLVCTDGRERTEAEYRELLQSAGFGKVEFYRTGSLVDAVLAIKD